MNFDLLGFIVLLFTLILMAALQVAAALGAMYALHQRRPFQELLMRWCAIIVPAVFGFTIAAWLLGATAQTPMYLSLALVSFPILFGLFALRDKVTESTYGHFDFENFSRPAFQELVTRLAVIFLPITLLLHMAEYLFVGRTINRYTFVICLVLFIIEAGAITAGFFLILKLEAQRALIFSAVSAIIYFFLLWYLVGRTMLF